MSEPDYIATINGLRDRIALLEMKLRLAQEQKNVLKEEVRRWRAMQPSGNRREPRGR